MKSFLSKIQLLKTFSALLACLAFSSCIIPYYIVIQSKKAQEERESKRWAKKELDKRRIEKYNTTLFYDNNLIEPDIKVHLSTKAKNRQIFKDKKVFKTVIGFNYKAHNIVELSKYMSVSEFKVFFKKLSKYKLSSEFNNFSDNESANQHKVDANLNKLKLQLSQWEEAVNLYQAAFEKKIGKKLGNEELFIKMIDQLSFLNALKGSNLKLAEYLLKKGAIINVKSYYQSEDLSPLSSALMSIEPHKTLLFLKAHGLKEVPLFDSENKSPLYILNIYSPNKEIDKILSYFLNQCSPQTEVKLYNITKLVQNNNINVLFALFNKKGDKLFKGIHKRKLLLSLITAQNQYSDIQTDCEKMYHYSKKKRCFIKLSTTLNERYQKNRELMVYLFKKYKIKPKILFRNDKALLEEIIKYDEEALNILLSFGLKPDFIKNASSLLHWALKNYKPFVIKAVLSKKNYRFSLTEKKIIMDQEFIEKNRALMLILINTPAFKASINMRNKDGKTLLMILVKRYLYFYDLVKAILKNGANVNLKDKWGRTALMQASYYSKKLLIKYKADIHLKDKWGRTALHYSVAYADFDSFKLLIKAGADIHIKDKDADNLLMTYFTSFNRRFLSYSRNLVKYLCKKINVNERNKNADTVLMYIIKSKKKYLIEAIGDIVVWGKADVNLKDGKGKRMVFLYSPLNNKYVKEADSDHYGNIILGLLKSPKLKLNVQDEHGYTPLMLLIISGSFYKTINKVIARSTNINIKDKQGKTALDHAYESKVYNDGIYASNRQKRIIESLIESGAKKGSELNKAYIDNSLKGF